MSSNALEFIELRLRNFLSFGPKETIISLNGDHITVVLGENRDTGGEDSRNGCGKSAIIDAISYCMFGKVVREISNQKLINKLSTKGSMIVSVEFTKGEYHYLIERTERPSKLFLFRKKVGDDSDFKVKEGRTLKYDISRGKNETTDQIIGILGFDITLFEYLVANTSESIEFLRLPEDKRRNVVEHLFGFTIMTEKANLLKEERKEKNKELLVAESSAEATRLANQRIESQIKDMEAKSSKWEEEHTKNVSSLTDTIKELETVDVAHEIETLKLAEEAYANVRSLESNIREIDSEIRGINNQLKDIDRTVTKEKSYITETTESLSKLADGTCPTCQQHWIADEEYVSSLVSKCEEAEVKIADAEKQKALLDSTLKELTKKKSDITTDVSNLQQVLQDIDTLNLTYNSVEEAARADTTLKSLREQLKTTEQEKNPYTDSISDLRTNVIQKINDSEIKDLRKLVDHYTFLIDLLTKKDSYLRKRIIDRWLPILNKRIAHWLDILELPHTVVFQPDLSAEIMDYHEAFDLGNLSKGERNRVRIALNFAFQDVFEFMNYSINLLAVDELIDSGICPRGAENAVRALQETCTKKKKRAFLITHRDDIAARVEDVMKIVKENRISRIEYGI